MEEAAGEEALSARKAAATVALSVVVGLGLAEGLTRVFLPVYDPSGQFEFGYEVGDLNLAPPNTVTRQTKNTGDFDVTVRIDRNGLRDDKDVARAAPDDILVVGNSFAWGWGVEARERFSNLVQADLGVPVYNVSTATDIKGDEELLAYARKLGARARNLILAIGLENDLGIYDGDGGFLHFSADAPRRGWLAETTAEGGRWLQRHSAAFVLMVTAVHGTPWLEDLAVRLGLIIPNFEGFPQNVYSPEMVRSSADLVQSIAKGSRTLVLLIPSRGLWVGANREVEDRIHGAMVAALAERGLDVLDMRPLMEAGGQPLAYHFAHDGHWNRAGHRLAAKAIAARIANWKTERAPR